MYFPTIQGKSPEKRILSVFGGINRDADIQDNEFLDMENMTGDEHPFLSVRSGREAQEDFTEDGEKLDLLIADHEWQEHYDKGTGVHFTDILYDYYYRGEKKMVHRNVHIDGYSNVGENQSTKYHLPIQPDMRGVVRFGNNVIRYPYPDVINQSTKNETPEETEALLRVGGCHPTANGQGAKSIWRSLAFGYPTSHNQTLGIYAENILFRIRHVAENKYTIKVPEDVGVNSYVYDSSSLSPYRGIEDIEPGERLRLEEYSVSNGVATLTGYDFGAAFFVKTGERPADGDFLGYAHDGTPLVDATIDYTIHNKDMFSSKGTVLENFKGVLVSKIETDANLLAVYQNRIWGTDTLGTSLYCSNATDFYDWKIDGTAAGGGYLDVSENTPWTAICEYGGYLYAFKAGKMYKVLGTNSLDYSIISLCDIGCTNHEAISACDSVLYFLSRDGVYGFTGNIPVKISKALDREYRQGRLASRGQKLYASLETIDGEHEFLVYDTERHTWHKEDDFTVRSFVDYTDGLYALGEDGVCYKLESGHSGADVTFSATTKRYFYTFDQKTVQSVNLFLDMDEGSSVAVEISYDGGEFAACGTFTNRRLKYIPIRVRKCDEFQFRISGRGFIRLKQMEFILHGGGRTIR